MIETYCMYSIVSIIQSPPRKGPRDRFDVPNRYQKNPTRTKKTCHATCLLMPL